MSSSEEYIKKSLKDFKKIDKCLDFKKFLKNKSIHLDFGCGHGMFSYLIAEKYPINVVGVDKDIARINCAKRRTLKNLNYLCSCSISSMYDSVSVIFVLHEIKNFEKILCEVYNHLNVGGRVFVYDFRKVSKKEFKKIYRADNIHREADFEEEYAEHNRFIPNEFVKICEYIGFKTLKLKKSGGFWFLYIGEK